MVSRSNLMRRSPVRLVGFMVALLVGVFGLAVAAQATGPSQPATITGYITDSLGEGIPNVLVQVSGETSVASEWGYMGFSQEATTDATGRYVITDVIQGTYDMYVNDPNNRKHVAAYAEAMPWHGEWAGPTNTRRHIIGGTMVSSGTDVMLASNGIVRGRAMDGITPIEGSQVAADITSGGILYSRWSTTGSDGRYAINDAPPGEWSLTLSGKNRELPAHAVPRSWNWQGDPATLSPADVFTVTEGGTVDRPVTEFDLGQALSINAIETYSGNSYWLPGMYVSAASDADPGLHTYTFSTGDNGVGSVYLPAGDYHVVVQGDSTSYTDASVDGTVTLTASASAHTEFVQMVPAAGSYVVKGHVSEAGAPGSNVAAWITAYLIDPSSTSLNQLKRVPSNGAANSLYMIRLPSDTGLAGNQIKLEISDQASPPDVPYMHVAKTFTVTGTTTVDPALVVGGSVSGTIHDGHGNTVPGCTVYATRRAFDPSLGAIAWVGADSWWTRTDIDGNYTIGGLPTSSNYKVNIVPDYNPGMALPIQYRDYYRRTYKAQPLVDSLNSSATPIGGVVDHTPVAVTIGADTANIDETITPGGYVALHADGPSYPTGAVWCDVWYSYGGQWFEIDSGYTTGGLFQKMWKVLPTGNYRLEYNDYFGRGGGTWNFALGAGEHKYASVLVPAPVSFSSAGTFSGAFAGVIGDSGLADGGTGGVNLSAAAGSVPQGAPPLPTGYIGLSNAVLNVTTTGTDTAGIWTLNLPYDPAVPDSDVPYLRVVHYKHGGGTEILAPIAWNTLKHTVMIQTSSLSPFRVVFKKHGVKLGTPVATSTWTHGSSHTVYGSLSPKHAAGVKSVKIMLYRRNSKGHYVWYRNVWAPNYTYHGSTRYRAKFSLGAGKYRFYAYAPADRWHLATKTKSYKYVYVK